MNVYEIQVNGQHAARVAVKDHREILEHVHRIRRVWDEKQVEIVDGERFEWYRDVDEGGVQITAQIVAMR